MSAPGSTIRDEHGESYRVISLLGEGGQGAAYDVVHTGTRLHCVAKLHHPYAVTPETEARLGALVTLNLSSRSSALASPFVRVAAAHGSGTIAPKAEGQSLSEAFKAPEWTLLQALGYATALTRVLAILEDVGVAHGDLAAGNVLIRKVKDFHVVSLIDFDNAFIPGAPAPTFVGQDFYAAPELLRGNAVTSVQSDRFAVSVLLHQVLYLRHPLSCLMGGGMLEFPDYIDLLSKGWAEDPLHGRPTPTGGIPVAALSRELQGLFRRGLQFDPDARPAASEWADALEAALHDLYECDCGGAFVNGVTRLRCPHCQIAAPTLDLVIGGNVVPLGGSSVLVGREDVGGDPTVSREHALFRRRGFGVTVENRSLNGLAVIVGGNQIEVQGRVEVSLGPGDRVLFVPGVEGELREHRN